MFKRIIIGLVLLMSQSAIAVGNGSIYTIYLDSSLKSHQVQLNGVSFNDVSKEKLISYQYSSSSGAFNVPGYISQPQNGRAATIGCIPLEYDNLPPGSIEFLPAKINIEMEGKKLSIPVNALFDPWNSHNQFEQVNYMIYLTSEDDLAYRQIYM